MYSIDYQHNFLFSSILPLRSTTDSFLCDEKISEVKTTSNVEKWKKQI